MTRKSKIHLDTSVISHLDQPGKPSECGHTHIYGQDIVAISPVPFYVVGIAPDGTTVATGYNSNCQFFNVSNFNE